MQEHPAWASPLHAIQDRLRFHRDHEAVRLAAFKALSGIQSAPPHVQLDGLFSLATAMAEALRLDPHEMVERARRMFADVEGPYTEQLQAARDYARGELRR